MRRAESTNRQPIVSNKKATRGAGDRAWLTLHNWLLDLSSSYRQSCALRYAAIRRRDVSVDPFADSRRRDVECR
jgi:hypothetical protein